MERFDLVDRDDTVIGATDKATAHSQGQLHRVVAVYAFSSSGELQVQMHKRSGLLDHSVGGHVSAGEHYDDAAMREAQEELGIASPLRRLAIFYSDETQNVQHMFALYETELDAAWKFVPNEEVDEVRPMDLGSVVAAMRKDTSLFTPGFLHTMKKYIEVKGLPFDFPDSLTARRSDAPHG